MTPRAWAPRPLLPAGQALLGKLTGRAGGAIPGTAPVGQQPLAPVVGDLVGDDRPSLEALQEMHRPGAPGHPHHAEQEDARPNNPLSGSDWDG